MDTSLVDELYQLYGDVAGKNRDLTGTCFAISATDRGKLIGGHRTFPGIVPINKGHKNSPVTVGVVDDTRIKASQPLTVEQVKTLHPRLVEFIAEGV